jgi:hypothetical protein
MEQHMNRILFALTAVLFATPLFATSAFAHGGHAELQELAHEFLHVMPAVLAITLMGLAAWYWRAR